MLSQAIAVACEPQPQDDVSSGFGLDDAEAAMGCHVL